VTVIISLSIWIENVPDCVKPDAEATVSEVELALKAVVLIKVVGGETERLVRFAPGPIKYPCTKDHPLGSVGKYPDCETKDPLTTLVRVALVKFVRNTLAPVKMAPVRSTFDKS